MQEKTTPPMEQITEHQQAERKLLESLAAEAGIAASYINAHGKQQAISAETKQRLLEAMHPFTPTQVGSPVPPVWCLPKAAHAFSIFISPENTLGRSR